MKTSSSESLLEETHDPSQAQSSERIDYAEFEFQDSTQDEQGQQNEPLLSYENSDEESTLNDSTEYKLPSEGGTIFSSFVSLYGMEPFS